MGGFGAAPSGWNPTSGFNRSRANSGGPGWTAGQSWGTQSPSAPSNPQTSAYSNYQSQQPQRRAPMARAAAPGSSQPQQQAANPIQAYEAAQKAPISQGYSILPSYQQQSQPAPAPADSGYKSTPVSTGSRSRTPDRNTPDEGNYQPIRIDSEGPVKPATEPLAKPAAPAPPPVTQVATPAPPPLAPTAEQVRANPSAYAGTSFDPARAIDPRANGDGRLANNSVQWQGVQVNPYDYAGNYEAYYGRPFDTSAMVPIPGAPGQFLTAQGGSFAMPGMNGGPGSEGFAARLQSAIRAGGPGVQAYLDFVNRNRLPLGYGNPTTESSYITNTGGNPANSGYLNSLR